MWVLRKRRPCSLLSEDSWNALSAAQGVFQDIQRKMVPCCALPCVERHQNRLRSCPRPGHHLLLRPLVCGPVQSLRTSTDLGVLNAFRLDEIRIHSLCLVLTSLLSPATKIATTSSVSGTITPYAGEGYWCQGGLVAAFAWLPRLVPQLQDLILSLSAAQCWRMGFQIPCR